MGDAAGWVESHVFAPWRRRLWSGVAGGLVLEVGVGSGPNIPYYPANAKVTAVDVNPGRIEAARQRALALGSPVELRVMNSERLDFPDAAFDSAVATLVFCSVPDPVQGLRELGRVVKPGGDIRLVEHVRIDRPVIGRLMDWLDPVMMLLGGEHLNRRTVANVIRSGLQLVSVEDLTRGGLVKLIAARSPCRLTESGSKYQKGR